MKIIVTEKGECRAFKNGRKNYSKKGILLKFKEILKNEKLFIFGNIIRVFINKIIQNLINSMTKN